jgi:hypothetical protein
MNLQTVTGISPDKITFGSDGLVIDNGSNVVADPTTASSETSSSGAIDYNELRRAYEDNEVGAEAKYGGKRLLVSGRVDSVRLEKGNIVMQFVTPFSTVLPVNCYFSASQKAAAGGLRRNQEVVVEGIVHGSIYAGIKLEQCVLR